MFVPTEIVAYADNQESARVFFPPYVDYSSSIGSVINFNVFPASFEGTLWNVTGSVYVQGGVSTDVSSLVDYDWYPYIVKISPYPDGSISEMYIRTLNAVGSYEVDGVLPQCRLNGTYTNDTSVSTFGHCYYCLIDYGNYLAGTPSASSSGNWRYMQISNYISPVISNDPVTFLYQFGENIVSVSNTVYEFLSQDIGGYSLLSLMFGSGFLIFAVWVVVKWVIP